MPKTLFWMQCGGGGGDTMALLGAESPDLVELLEMLDVEVLWHPSLSRRTAADYDALCRAIDAGEVALDILCVEGSIVLTFRWHPAD